MQPKNTETAETTGVISFSSTDTIFKATENFISRGSGRLLTVFSQCQATNYTNKKLINPIIPSTVRKGLSLLFRKIQDEKKNRKAIFTTNRLKSQDLEDEG